MDQFGDDDFEALEEQKIEEASRVNAMPEDDGTTLDFPPTNDTTSFTHAFALDDPDAYDSVDNDGITRLNNINNYHSPGQTSIREIENEVRTASKQAGLPYHFTYEDHGVNYTIERRPGVGDFIIARNGEKEEAAFPAGGYVNEKTGEILPMPADQFDAELNKIVTDPMNEAMLGFVGGPTTQAEIDAANDFLSRIPITIHDLPGAMIRGGARTMLEVFASSPAAQLVDHEKIEAARAAITKWSDEAEKSGVIQTGAETLTGFIVAFNPIVRALRLAGVGGSMSTIIAFGLVKAVATNPDDANLANLIMEATAPDPVIGVEEMPVPGEAVTSSAIFPLGTRASFHAIAAFLATEPGSPEEDRAERFLREGLNRFRNFAVGVVEGVGIEGVIGLLRLAKHLSLNKVEMSAFEKEVNEAINELRKSAATREGVVPKLPPAEPTAEAGGPPLLPVTKGPSASPRPAETSTLLATGEAAFQQDIGTVSRTLGISEAEAERILQAAAERGVDMEGAIIEGGGRVVHASKMPTAVSRPPSPVETPAPKNQEEIVRVRNNALKKVNRTTGKLVKNTAVVNGVASHLRMSATTAPKSVERIPKGDLVPQEKAPANREKVYENMDRVKRNHPNAMSSPTAYAAMQAQAFGTRDVPVSPDRLIHIVNNPETSVKELRLLSNKQRSDAADGLALAAKARKLIEDGKWPVITTVQNFLWGSLSKGVTPLVQESSFLDVARKATPLFNRAIKGNFTEADLPKWEKLGDLIFTKGSGKPGEGARANFNAFGKQFLLKLSKRDKDGVTVIQKIHDLFTDLNKTGPQVRREILALAPGSGFDGKVLSFNLLGSGRTDVLVVDRVQFENLYNHENKFDGINLYDGFKEKRMVKSQKTGEVTEQMATVNGSDGAKIFFGPRGLLHYEVMEDGLAKVVPDIYRALGRPDDGTLGNWHWENWVLKSGQSVGHPTLDTLVKSAEGDPAAFRGVTIENGKFDTYGSGSRWTIDGSGRGVYTYRTADGTPYKFSPMRFKELREEFAKPKNGVVPKGFKVSDHTTAPWFESKEVDLGKRDEIVRRLGRPVGGDGGGDEPFPGGPVGPRGGGGEAGPESSKVRIKDQVAEGREPPTLVEGKVLNEVFSIHRKLLTPEEAALVSSKELAPEPPLTPGLQAFLEDNKRILGLQNRDTGIVEFNMLRRLLEELKAQNLPSQNAKDEFIPLITVGEERVGVPILQGLARIFSDKIGVSPAGEIDDGAMAWFESLPEQRRGGLGTRLMFNPAVTEDLLFTVTAHEVGHMMTYRMEFFRKNLMEEVRGDRNIRHLANLGEMTRDDVEIANKDLLFNRLSATLSKMGYSPQDVKNLPGEISNELYAISRGRRPEPWDFAERDIDKEFTFDDPVITEAARNLTVARHRAETASAAATAYLGSTAELTGDGMAELLENPDRARQIAPNWVAFVKKMIKDDEVMSRIIVILGLSGIMLPGIQELLPEVNPAVLEEINQKTLEAEDGASP